MVQAQALMKAEGIRTHNNRRKISATMALVCLGVSLAFSIKTLVTSTLLLLCSSTVSAFEKLLCHFKERCETWKQINANANE